MEQNKLIAEFMGFQKTKIGWYDSEEIMPPISNTYDSNTFDEHELAFQKSWDWLMPVVKECYDNGAEGDEIGDITHALLDCDRDATYKAVVKFINQLKTK